MPTIMNPAVIQHIPTQYAQTHKDMMAYNGTFNLIWNIRRAFMKYGKLSDKQWAAVQKCLQPPAMHDPNVILVPNCAIPIVISANMARYIAKTNKWPMNPCTLLVTQILSQHRGTMKLKVKMDWSGTVSACRCCGKSLTDWRSQATGVGPVCVKRTNIKYVTSTSDISRFQQEMEALCISMGEVVVDIKQWSFKDGLSAVTDAIASNTPVTVASTTVAAAIPVTPPINHIYELSNFIWDEVNRTLSPKIGVTIKAPLISNGNIDIYNPITGVTVRFVKDHLGWSNIQHVSNGNIKPMAAIVKQIAPIKLLI